MNQYNAKVTGIESTDIITYIHLECNGTSLNAIVSKPIAWLDIGDEVICEFKEASVSVSHGCPGKVSIENCVPATLKEYRHSNTLFELTLESKIGDVKALITEGAFERLELNVGSEVMVLLRGLDITLNPIVKPMILKGLQALVESAK